MSFIHNTGIASDCEIGKILNYENEVQVSLLDEIICSLNRNARE